MPDTAPSPAQLVDFFRSLVKEKEAWMFESAKAVFERRKWLTDTHRAAYTLDPGLGVPVRVEYARDGAMMLARMELKGMSGSAMEQTEAEYSQTLGSWLKKPYAHRTHGMWFETVQHAAILSHYEHTLTVEFGTTEAAANIYN